MPRYLGLDYLTEAFTQRRQFLNKSVLTVPQHLEYVEKYAHSGSLTDSLYRLPWKKVRPDENFLSQEGKKAETDVKLVTSGFRSPSLEKLDSKLADEDIPDSQVIPSSNPASQEPFANVTVVEDIQGCKSTDRKNLQYEEEVFAKLDLHSDYDEKKLEEVMTKEPMSEYILNLPSVNTLLSRLQKYNISDPLAQQELASSPISLLNADILINQSSNSEKDSKVDLQVYNQFKGDFEKVNLYPTSTCQNTLEETICETKLEPLIEPGSVKQLIEGLATEDEDEELPVYDVLSKLTETKPAVSLNVESLPPVDKKKTNFVDINGGCEFEKVCLVEPLLIDPMLDTISPETTDEESWMACHRNITSEQLSQDDICFLTSQSKDLLYQTYWKEEKFFNETLALRLKEPDIATQELTLEPCVVQMGKIASMKKLNISLDEELDLCWDPLRTFKAQTRKPPSVEPVSVLSSSTDSNFPLTCLADYDSSETFEKYSLVFLHGWSDPLLPQPVRDSGFGTLKAAILARQKKDKLSALPSNGRSKGKKRLTSVSVSNSRNGDLNTKVFSDVDKYQKYTEDPLSHFLMMRSAQNTTHNTDPSPNKEIRPKSLDSCPAKQISPDKSKSKVINTTFTDEYGEVAEVLLEFSQPILSHLYEAGVLPEHQHLSTIPPDMTRFLLKQTQRQNTAGNNTEKTLLLLHVVSCVYNVYLHCSLEAAIFCLGAMEQKYQQQIEGNLTSLRSRLFQMQCVLKDKHLLHPKLREILTFTEDWLRRKKRKDPDSDLKILVIVRRDINGLLSQICQTLASSSFIQPIVYSYDDKDYNSLLNRLDNVNCVITAGTCVEETFPWPQFSLVIEHEYQPQTGWLNTCQRQNIRYLGLKVDLNRVHMENRVSKPAYEQPSSQLFMVCSQKVTTNTILLQLLESRYNCVLIERDNSKLKTDCKFADLVLDAQTGITLQNIENLAKDTQVEELFNKLTSFHLKFSQFWLILYANETKSVLDKRKSASVSRLQRALSTFSSTAVDFSIEVMMCKDLSEVAKVICVLGESVLKNSDPSAQASQMDNRQFTAEEKHLLLFPCFNTLSVHLILKIKHLEELMEMSVEDLIRTFTFLPKKVLQAFYRIKSSTAVVPLEDGNVRKPCHPNPDTTQNPKLHRPGSSTRDIDHSEEAKLKEYSTEYNDVGQSVKSLTQGSERTFPSLSESTGMNIPRRHNRTAAWTRPDLYTGNNIQAHKDYQQAQFNNTEIMPEIESLNPVKCFGDRTNQKYDTSQMISKDMEIRPSEFETKAGQQYDSQPVMVCESRPQYEMLLSHMHAPGKKITHVGTNNTIKEYSHGQQTLQDTADGYGNFQISLSPSLEPSQDLNTYEDKKVEEDSQLQDSEELNIPKPNEFAMAEIEGNLDTSNLASQNVPLETRTVSDTADQNLNLRTNPAYLYPEKFSRDDRNDTDIHHQFLQYLSAENVLQYDISNKNMNMQNLNKNLEAQYKDYSNSMSLNRYPIGQQQSRVVCRDKRSNTDFSHLTTSTILGSVGRPNLSKKKHNYQQENSAQCLPGAVMSANCHRFNNDQESYVKDFMNSIRIPQAISQDSLSYTSQEAGHGGVDIRGRRPFGYDWLQGFNHGRNSNVHHQQTETIANSRFTDGHPKLDRHQGRFQGPETHTTLRSQNHEYLGSSYHPKHVKQFSDQRLPEIDDRWAVKRLHKSGGHAVDDTSIKPHYNETVTDIDDRRFQLPLDRNGTSLHVEQQNQLELTPGIADNHGDPFPNQHPSSRFTGYRHTGTMSDPQQYNITPQDSGAVSNDSQRLYSTNTTWSHIRRSGAALHRNPPHWVSIGLAQPFPRNQQTVTEPADILTVHGEDSPPMDLDYDLEQQSVINPIRYQGLSRPISRLETGGYIPGRGINPLPQQHNGEGREPEMLSLLPSKSKRLCLEKVPGSRGGQTRLSFS